MRCLKACALATIVVCTGAVSTSLGLANASPAGSVVVPHLAGVDFQRAYDRLHRLRLRVTVLERTHIDSLTTPSVYVMHMNPAPGARVQPGSIETLALGCVCGVASPGVPSPLPKYRVPSFVGRRVSAAWTWVRHKQLYFDADLGPLNAGDARHFYDNYRVKRQRPAAGTILTLGRGKVLSPTSGSFTPTPLKVRATQR